MIESFKQALDALNTLEEKYPVCFTCGTEEMECWLFYEDNKFT